MNDLLNDFHNWDILCYEKYHAPKMDMLEGRKIIIGYVLFHVSDGTVIFAGERSWEKLKQLLTEEAYNNMDFYLCMYLLQKSYYSTGYFSLKAKNIPKQWGRALFNTSRFKQMYFQISPMGLEYNSMRNLLDDYVNERIVLGATQMEKITRFLDEVLFPIFIANEKRKCLFYKQTFRGL